MRSVTGNPGWSTPERAAFIVAASSVRPTFRPGMLPRSVTDQAVATGLIAAVNHAAATTGHVILLSLAGADADGSGRSAERVEWVAGLGAIGIGSVLWVAGSRVPAWHLPRTLGYRVTRGGAAGVLAVGAEAAGIRLRGRIPDWASPSGRPFAAAVALVFATKAVRRSRRDGGSFAGPVRSPIGGGCVSVGLIAIGRAERAVSRRVAAAVGRVMPPGPAGTAAEAVAGRATVLAGALWITQRRIHRSALAAQDREGRLDPSQPEPPVGTSVSGSASSSIRYDTVAQQGSRFLHGATSSAAIARVAGTCRAEPVRVYVGLRSGDAPGERVGLAMGDLEQFGAFDRAVLCVAVPAGTGFVNPVAISALEYLTRGDCATVALQYSLRRSFQSLGRVAVSAEQNRLLLAAIGERLAAVPADRRPRLVLYGESLGAHAAQESLDGDGVDALASANIDLALFVGTPARSAWARRWRARPDIVDPGGQVVEVASYEEWKNLPAPTRDAVRVVLLSHLDDPVTIFDRRLLIRPPVAGRAPDPRSWRPLTSFTLAAIDLKNAMTTDAVRFSSTGHDYRADLARMVAAAYRLPCDEETMIRIESALSSGSRQPQ